ncbi:MAG: pilus assembly protein PilM [Chlamydiae bacterium]|nr:pilus assembly protein PilM [Chlamydiota bacterium]MBI3266601.1 pilus assembly protein PilM [Chlamydiota bacterium]
MNKKKSGLSKEISSIFDGVPDLEGNVPSPSLAKPAMAPTGRNALIPIEKSFSYFWGRMPRSRYRAVLEIGSGSLKWICLEKGKKGDFRLAGIAYEILPFLHDRGQFLNSLKEKMGQIRAKAKGIFELDLLISEPTILFNSLSIAKANQGRARQVLLTEMVRRNPTLRVEDYWMGFCVSKRPSREKPDTLRVMMGQIKKEELEDWVEVIEGAGWRVRRVEGTPFAVERFLSQVGLGRGETVGVLEMGLSHTSILFCREGDIEYQRRLPVSSQDLTESFQKPVVVGETKFTLTREEAEELKWSVGFPYGEGEVKTSLGKVLTHEQIGSLIRLPLERLVREIQSSIQFYLHAYKTPVLKKFFLMGDGTRVPNLERYLREGLMLSRLEILSPFKMLKWDIPQGDLGNLESAFTSVLGAAFMEESRLDLRPEGIKKFDRLGKIGKVFKIAACGVVAFIGILFIFDFLEIAHLDQTFKATYGNFEKASEALSRVAFLQGERMILKREINFYQSVVGAHPFLDNLLRELSRAMLDPIYLNDLHISREKDLWVLNVKGVILEGHETQEHVLSEFLVRLEDTYSFFDTDLVTSTRTTLEKQNGLEFEIRCRLKT